MIRHPLVAGRFYPASEATLRADLTQYTTPRPANLRAKACMVPHAGYMYSGAVAGAVYAALDLPSRFVILAPDHFGRGADFALHPAEAWDTPLGRAKVDRDLAASIQQACPQIVTDERGHAEHSLEVQIPFLQHLCPDFTFVPIAIRSGSYEELVTLGETLALAVQPDTLIVASSDMNHYEDERTTRRKDHIAIDAMLTLDTEALFQALRRERISMCGFGPAIAAMAAARLLGATRGELIRHATSGDAPGSDRDRVVGYAGMVFL